MNPLDRNAFWKHNRNFFFVSWPCFKWKYTATACNALTSALTFIQVWKSWIRQFDGVSGDDICMRDVKCYIIYSDQVKNVVTAIPLYRSSLGSNKCFDYYNYCLKINISDSFIISFCNLCTNFAAVFISSMRSKGKEIYRVLQKILTCVVTVQSAQKLPHTHTHFLAHLSWY